MQKGMYAVAESGRSMSHFKEILLQLKDVICKDDLLSISGELRAHRQRKEQVGSFNNRSEES
jgi:hypothetical protein